MADEPFTFTLRITIDTICAWCYIHHVRLTRAIHLYSKTYNSRDNFQSTYLPYLLQPQLSTTSVPVQEKFLERFGEERAAQIQTTMDRIGRADGIEWSRTGRVGDSRASHAVIAAVGRQGGGEVQSKVVGEILRRYFGEGGDITDEGMLIDCAIDVGGLSDDDVRTALADGELRAWIDDEAARARREGIEGVPHMVVNGVVIDGARDVEDLLESLIQIRATGKLEEAPPNGEQSLGVCEGGICS